MGRCPKPRTRREAAAEDDKTPSSATADSVSPFQAVKGLSRHKRERNRTQRPDVSRGSHLFHGPLDSLIGKLHTQPCKNLQSGAGSLCGSSWGSLRGYPLTPCCTQSIPTLTAIDTARNTQSCASPGSISVSKKGSAFVSVKGC